MQINYSFLSDEEPTDEQLQLLMHEVAVEAEAKASKANAVFWEQLKELVKNTKQDQIDLNLSAR